MPRIESIVIHAGPQGLKGDPSLTVGPNTLALAVGETVTGAPGAVKNVPFYFNVRAWAAGDGTTLDTTNITNADAAARATKAILYFPPGTYLTRKLTPQTGSRWLLHKDAILQLDPASNATAVIEIGHNLSDIVIEGGQCWGNWVKATYNNTGTSGGVSGQYGVKVTSDAAGYDIHDVTIRRMKLVNIAGPSLFQGVVANASISTVTYEDIDTVNCLAGPSINGGGTTLAQGLASQVTLRRLTVDDTYHSTTAINGADAIVANNIINDLIIEDCWVTQCGRMAIEVAPTAYDTYGAMPQRLRIRRCYFGPSAYRTLSASGDDFHLHDNTVIDNVSWTEVNGRQVSISRNSFTGTGLWAPGANPPVFPKAYFAFASWTVVDNTFANLASQTGAIKFQYIDNPTIARNTIRIDSQIPVGSSYTPDPVILVNNCTRPIVRDNRIVHTAPVLERNLWSFTGNVFGQFCGNTIELDVATTSALVYSQPAGTYPTPIAWGYNANCTISDNTLTAQSSFAVAWALIWSWHNQPSTSKRRVFTSATAYTDTTLTNPLPLNTPPGSPATNDLYLVGSTPTGAWASNPESLATWNGSAWTFQVIKDIYPLVGAVFFGGDAVAPLVATTGDVYLLVNNTPIGNVIERNQIDRLGKLTFNFDAFSLDSGSGAAGLSWRNRFTGNTWGGSYQPVTRRDLIFKTGDIVQQRATDASLGQNFSGTITLPPATLARRGWTYQVQSAAGVADRLVICAKDATNAYVWKDLY